ncbi:MAG TPA: hypothetical protein VKA63_07280 [Candidatus Krumholzibacteria bacterium]|nr:hypothetical protein [Candidatus Krumholzibacteria bacterium]
MINRATAIFAAVLLICLMPVLASAQLVGYSQDFEGLGLTDTGALASAGFVVYGTVFAPDGVTWLGGYGTYPAPNSGPPYAFCTIADGQGGAAQGSQQLVAFSDYNNSAAHSAGNIVESNVFQEQTIGVGDVGHTWYFTFQAKHGDLVAPSTALAFIKTLDPGNGYATTNYITVDMTNIPSTWGDYALSIVIDPALAGQILQFGFSNRATNYNPSGTYYDNLSFYMNGAVPAQTSSWGKVKSLYQ